MGTFDLEKIRIDLFYSKMSPITKIIHKVGMKVDSLSETPLGEAQAWVHLKSGKSIEITCEEVGTNAYYSVRLHCSEEEFEKDYYHETMGVIQEWYCGTFQEVETALREIKGRSM